MIIECPNCNSTFSIANKVEMNKFSNFKCSVCKHVWKIEIYNEKSTPNKYNKIENSYSYILILNAVIIFFVIIAIILFKDKLIYVNDFWNNFYGYFFNLIPIK